MITDFLLEHAAAVPVAALLLVVCCAATGFLLLRARRYGHRIAWALAALSLLPVVALTLVPSADGVDAIGCTVQLSLPTPTRVELLANVVLFVPPVFFATLATRRPLTLLAAGASLSAVIEAVQAVVPAIGRACDTNDWAMNTTGTVVAILLACAITALAARGLRARRPDRPPRRRGSNVHRAGS